MHMDRTSHWEDVYTTKQTDQVSWYQQHPETSLEMIAATGKDSRILDVGGGSSFLVDHLLRRGFTQIGVLDISPTALANAQHRLGEKGRSVEWFVADVTRFNSPHSWEIWHDRATFHFLTEEKDRQLYKARMEQALAPDGQAVIATFGVDGPTTCSKLNVCRYDPSSLAEIFSPVFEFVDHKIEMHRTPAGSLQQFLYCRFGRS
jgi:SAM-dependent methyltransferase